MADELLYTNINIRETGPAEVEIRGDIPLDALEHHRSAVLRSLQGRVHMPGFRPGHIPEHLLCSEVGEGAIFEDMAERAIREAYPRIVRDRMLNPVGKPVVTLTPYAPGNPVGFSIRTALMPTVTLPDYRAIARDVFGKKDDVDITEQEVTDATRHIREALAMRQKTNTAMPETAEGNTPLPELTDRLVKEIGPFTDVADFTKKLRKQILHERHLRVAEKKRIEASERITEKAQATIPVVLIDSELETLFTRLVRDIERGGVTFRDYLVRIGKSEEDIRRELRPHAEKNTKLQIALNEIVRVENIKPAAEEVERLVTIALKREPNANPDSLRAHVKMVLANEAVFQLLEKEGGATIPKIDVRP